MKAKNQIFSVYRKFEYHLADTECRHCLYYKGKKQGCTLTACSCEDIKNEAVENGRIKRMKGSA